MGKSNSAYSFWDFLLVTVLCIIVLAGCGVTASSSFIQENTITPSTPTQSPLEATKAAQDLRIEQELATAHAQPRRTVILPVNDTIATPTIETGFSIDCESMLRLLVYEVNCWRGIVGTTVIFIVGGEIRDDGSDPNNENNMQGSIAYYTYNMETYEESNIIRFNTPEEHGSVMIEHVELPKIYVRAQDGTKYIFDWETHQWSTINGSR